MCSAYADWDSLCLMCSRYLCLKRRLFVQYMTFCMHYIWVFKCRSCPVPEYYWSVLVLWVVEYWYSWIFLYSCAWIGLWFSLFLGCRMWKLPFFVFVFSPVDLILVGFLCCNCRFGFCMSFCRKLLFRVVSCIIVHSVCFFFGVNGSECLVLMWSL